MKTAMYKGYTFHENGYVYNFNGREKKIRLNRNKYEIKLSYNGKIIYHTYHRIRSYLFVEKFDINNKNICVVAKDGDYTNLDLSNYYLEDRQVIVHRDNHKVSKLTTKQVEEIREKYKSKSGSNQHDMTCIYSYQFLADYYGVSKGLIAMIIRGEI